MTVFIRIERSLDRLGHALMTWRAAAVALVLLAAVVLAMSLLVRPVDGTEQLFIGSMPFGGGCEFRRQSGFGCPSCGMTRSFAFGVRGQVLQAFAYNAAGATLLYGVLVGGLLSAVRLALRRRVLVVPLPITLAMVAAWFVVWAGLFGLRAAGFFPLPPDPAPAAPE